MKKKDLIDILVAERETLSDDMAARCKELYNFWKDVPNGTFLKTDTRLQHEDALWKVRAPGHNKQDNWPPSIDTASLWERIDVTHAGTIEDPIPFDIPMRVFKDKHYIYNGVIYQCIQNSGIPLNNYPNELIDINFIVVGEL